MGLYSHVLALGVNVVNAKATQINALHLYNNTSTLNSKLIHLL